MYPGTKKNIPVSSYRLMQLELAELEGVKDLGIIVDSSLRVSPHCAKVLKKPNSLLGTIRNKTENKMVDIIMPLYRSWCCPTWNTLCNSSYSISKRVSQSRKK